jgi:hypothetical protein
VNAHAEELRSFFVSHEGKKELTVQDGFGDFGAMALQMTDLIAKIVVDRELRTWIMPDFSTHSGNERRCSGSTYDGCVATVFQL